MSSNENGMSATNVLNSLRNGSFPAPQAPAAPVSDAQPKQEAQTAQAPAAQGNEESLGSLYEKGGDVTEAAEGSPNLENSDSADTEIVPSSSHARIKVKAAKGEREFVLDPSNPELLEALQFGVAGKKVFAQAKKQVEDYKRKVESFEKQFGSLEIAQKHASTMSQVAGLIEKGYTEQAVQALLGDKYAEFKDSAINGTIAYENASPYERSEIEKQMLEKQKSYEIMQKERELNELRDSVHKMQQSAVEERIYGVAETLLTKYDASQYIEDGDRAEQLNRLLWNNALEESYKSAKARGEDAPAAQDLARSFRRNASILFGNADKQASQKLAQLTEAKKQQASQQARAVATRNTSAASPASAGSDLVTRLKQAMSPLEKLKILQGL